MDVLQTRYRDNLSSLQDEIAAHCFKSSRDPSTVTLVAVTKYVGPEAVVPLLSAGVRNFGENRLQQALPKLAVPGANEVLWHFIGHLQRNKVKDVVQRFDWIHAIDSEELGVLVSQVALDLNRSVNCLIQVNVSGEETKSGIRPNETISLVESLQAQKGIQVRGLMTMAPLTTDESLVRTVFRDLRMLLEHIRDQTKDSRLTELSMGMSNDYGMAVEEGATMVRIGRRLLGV